MAQSYHLDTGKTASGRRHQALNNSPEIEIPQAATFACNICKQLRIRMLLLLKRGLSFFRQAIRNQRVMPSALSHRAHNLRHTDALFCCSSEADAKNCSRSNGEIRHVSKSESFHEVRIRCEKSYLRIIGNCLLKIAKKNLIAVKLTTASRGVEQPKQRRLIVAIHRIFVLVKERLLRSREWRGRSTEVESDPSDGD